MKALNVEIKARCAHPDHIRDILKALDARFAGLDHQVDTYYRVPQGRLKLRQGNIENALIAYFRPDTDGPKRSDVLLYQTSDGQSLKAILDAIHETVAIVDKRREIYFIDNVKFHVDDVTHLGSFVEIEAIDDTGENTEDALLMQCEAFIALFGIHSADILTHSYCDMLVAHS